jgi:type III pantothenate kinase
MLLALDVGNTNLVCAVFDGETLQGQWRMATHQHRTPDEYALALQQLMALHQVAPQTIDAAIMSSVVPAILHPLAQSIRHFFHTEPMILGAEGVDLGIKVDIDRPQEAGADRLVNAHAAYHTYGGNVVVLDFGTATTFDVINEAGSYIGGVIAPGINLSVDALHQAAAKLPRIAITTPEKVIGRHTVEAMQSGVYHGYVSLVEGLIHKIQAEYGAPLTVVATGGLAPLFAKATEAIEHLDRDLTIRGLQMIHGLNQHHFYKKAS